MAGADREPMKVVIIETVHVKTDSMSFKSVVQNLTGKESSCVENRKRSPSVTTDLRGGLASSLHTRGGASGGGANRNCGGSGGTRHNPVLTRESSFKEFERMMMELPSMDELRKFWDEPGN